jgi:putative hydrolase of the HAD superfamily
VAATHILFDFFGTLVAYQHRPDIDGYQRSHEVLAKAGYEGGYSAFVTLWETAYADLEREAKTTHREFSMRDLAESVIERAQHRAGGDLARRLAATYLQEWNQGVRYLDGIGSFIRGLSSRFELGIITNTHDTELVPLHLAAMGLTEHFEVLVTSVEFGVRKPSPEVFQEALRRLDVDASSCVYVGDNVEADYRGGLAVGIDTFLIDPADAHGVEGTRRLDSLFDLAVRL